MPSCWLVLFRFWLRVDHVLLRLRETRLMAIFGGGGVTPRVVREVSEQITDDNRAIDFVTPLSHQTLIRSALQTGERARADLGGDGGAGSVAKPHTLSRCGRGSAVAAAHGQDVGAGDTIVGGGGRGGSRRRRGRGYVLRPRQLHDVTYPYTMSE